MPRIQAKYRIARVLRTETYKAFRFHHEMVQNDRHLAERNREKVRKMADLGCLFAAWDTVEDDIAAICYLSFDGDDHGENEWEIGGLVVSPAARNNSVGRVLFNVTLAFNILQHSILENWPEVAGYVHEKNRAPRKLLANSGFVDDGRIVLSSDDDQMGLVKNENGEVVGDRFVFRKDGLPLLLSNLRDHREKIGKNLGIQVDLGELWSLDLLIEGIGEMCSDLGVPVEPQ